MPKIAITPKTKPTTMNKAVLFIEKMILMGIIFSCCNTEEILPIDMVPTVNFSLPSATLDENNEYGLWVRLHLSQVAYENGEVSIKQMNRGEFNPFQTNPGISDTGIIKIPVDRGSSEIMFKVVPINDEVIAGHQEIQFRIEAVAGNLSKGSQDVFTLKFVDDDLGNKLKSYETLGNTGFYKQEFSYNEVGKVVKVLWTNGINPSQNGQYLYSYNNQGLLHQIGKEPDMGTQLFSYKDGKMFKKENSAVNEIAEYETYGMNEHGILESIIYSRKYPNGFEETFGYRAFSYFPNGNVKVISYYTYTSPGIVELKQRITYSEYTIHDNPLPYYSGVNGLLYQPKLPGKIAVEEHGQTYNYNIDYAIYSNGKVAQRTLRGIGGDEVTKYFYY